MKDPNCGYCGNKEILDTFAYKITEMPTGTLYLFKEQSHRGRVVLAYKDHVDDISDLSKEDRDAFMADVIHVSKTIQALFHPTRINYGMYNDKGHHMHMHMVPKYEDGFEFGGVFEMNPKKNMISEEDAKGLIDQIRNAL